MRHYVSVGLTKDEETGDDLVLLTGRDCALEQVGPSLFRVVSIEEIESS